MNVSRLSDLLRMLRAAKLSRAFNYFALVSSYALSILIRKPVRWGMPAFVTVEPTALCNLHCPECPAGAGSLSRPSGYMTAGTYERILNGIGRNTIYLTMYFQGEPYMHRDFFQMIEQAKQKGMYVAVSTNAHFLDAENAEQTIRAGTDRIIVSFDGPDAESYESYRKGGNWEKVLAGVRNLIDARESAAKKSPCIVLQCLVMRSNENKLEAVRKLFLELGADRLEFKTIQLLDPSKQSSLLPLRSRHSRYTANKDGGYRLKKKLRNHCFRSWSSCVITWDGMIAPCCYDKNAEYVFGNIHNDAFLDIWKGPAAETFLAKLLHHRSDIMICRNCDN